MNSTLITALILIILSAIGLVFFIWAAVKDRTTQIQLLAPAPETELLDKLQTHLQQRAYHVKQANANDQEIIFEGYVQPSWFMAILLTGMAACGALCLGLTMTILWPSLGAIPWTLVSLAPVAGGFYWRKAGRLEQVNIKLQTSAQPDQPSIVTVTAHRDELAKMRNLGEVAPSTAEI